MFKAKRIIIILTALAMGITVLTAVPASAQEATEQLEEAGPHARGAEAIEQLGAELSEVASANGMSSEGLRSLLAEDETLVVDNENELLYFDLLAPGEVARTFTGDILAEAPPTVSSEFQLASNPGAPKTIYLDFDGHTTEGTTWNDLNSLETILSPAYDVDGSPETWSSTELDIIANAWASVAEDFAPWNVNVTTMDPGVDALQRTSSVDQEWGVRVVITTDTFLNCECGGAAYVGAFDDFADEPAFIFNNSRVGVSEAISHEVGHTMLLAHDGTKSGEAYYPGHSSPETPGWAPIMGESYTEPVTQWSRQDYFDANNDDTSANFGNGRDDYEVISSLTNGNGFGLKPDDHGDTNATATEITEALALNSGVVGARRDRDLFFFTTAGGMANVTASPSFTGPNLDIALSISTPEGVTVASANPSNDLGASISTELDAGTYFIAIDGRGLGSPTASPASGFSDYASLGQYTLDTMIDGLGSVVLSISNVAPSEPVTVPDETPVPVTDVIVAPVTVADETPAPETPTPLADAPVANAPVIVADETPAPETPAPVAPVTVTPTMAHASSEIAVAGSVTGSLAHTHIADGIVQTITEVETDARWNRRHDFAEHQWLLPAEAGNQSLRVVGSATDGGDADTGFLLEWSADGASWTSLSIITERSPIDASFNVASTSDTIWVRIIDTNRSRRQHKADSVSIDLLELTSGGESVTSLDTTSVTASITTSKLRSGARRNGVATVTVTDDQGATVAGATVTTTFSGDFNETLTMVTDADGVAVFTTTKRKRKPDFSACIADVTLDGRTLNLASEAC